MKKEFLILLMLCGLGGFISGCNLVDEKECYANDDCLPSQTCMNGNCSPQDTSSNDGLECFEDSDCATGMTCERGKCILTDSSDENNGDPANDDDDLFLCPSDMVGIDDQFCMDMYEASKSDATENFMGDFNTLGPSRADVIPWFPVSYQTAKQACEAVGKRLCTEDEWSWVCQNGDDQTIYSYGDTYAADTCNGIDAFCEDPYPHCRQGNDYFFKVQPTGTFLGCTSKYSPFDLNGNVWEWVEGATEGNHHLRGGAYNCGNSERLHKCSYVAGDSVSAKGFRCCCDGN